MEDRHEVLQLLRDDARYDPAELAHMTEYTEAEIESLVTQLESEGVIAGYQAVIDWDALADTDERVRATVEVNVQLDRETNYGDIAERIARFSTVTSLRLVSGDYDFDVTVEGDSMGEVSRFVSDKIAPMPEITQTVTHYIMESYKEGGELFTDAGDDDRRSVTP